jgi:hypothetical protein
LGRVSGETHTFSPIFLHKYNMDPNHIPFHYAVRLHLAWAVFAYWYIVFANGPLDRKRPVSFYQFAQKKVAKGNEKLIPPTLLRVFTTLHIACFFVAVWIAYPYYLLKWACVDLAAVTLRYWFPLWLRWTIRNKTPQQIAEWRDDHLTKLANVAGNL